MTFTREAHIRHLAWKKRWEMPEDSDDFSSADAFDVANWVTDKLNSVVLDLPVAVFDFVHGLK